MLVLKLTFRKYCSLSFVLTLAIGLFLGTAAPTWGQLPSHTSFVALQAFPVGQNPIAMATSDLRRNGKLDVITANVQSSDVSVLLGNGDGTYQDAVNYPVGTAPFGVVVADFDGDGVPDLAVASSSGISVLLGKGNGTFHSATTVAISAGTPSHGLVAADFNGDGKMDVALIIAPPQIGTVAVAVLLGNGAGGFRAPASFSVHSGASFIAVGDFNGDGKRDLITSGSSSVSVLLGKGDGTFRAAVDSPSGQAPGPIAVADFDGDAKQDIVLGDPGALSAAITFLRGVGDGTFQAPSETSINISGTVTALAVSDFNGDHLPDLAVDTNGFVGILLGKGDGTFTNGAGFATGAASSALVAGDLLGTGRSHLAIADSTSNNVAVAIGNGDGTFQASSLLPTVAGASFPVDIVAADFTGDGKSDLILLSPSLRGTSPGFALFRGNGNGSFATPQFTPIMDNSPASEIVADLNHDGKPDLVIGGNFVGVFLGNGDGTFHSEVDYSLSGTSVAVGDFNGDGNLDVVNVEPGQIELALGHGDGTFGLTTTVSAGPSAIALAVADFNHDGKLDLAVCNQDNSGTVSIFLGNGDGTFRPPVTYPAGSFPTQIVVADFNHDSHPDIAVISGNGGHTVSILMNEGNGTFAAPHTYDLGNAPAAIAVADFNGDGVPDLAIADADTVSILAGKGDGSFQSPVNFVTGSGTTSSLFLTAADFNGDGFSDLVVGTAILLNRGNGTSGVQLTPSTLPAFANQDVGTHSSPQNITLTNTGVSSLTLSVSIVGANAGDFSQTNTCPKSIMAGASCTIKVVFTPTAPGPRSASLSISDSASHTPHLVALSGTGQDFTISVSTHAAKVAAGQSAHFSLDLSSAGGFSQTLSITCSGAPAAATCTPTPASVNLNGATASTVNIAVTTTARSGIVPLPFANSFRSFRYLPFVVAVIALFFLYCTQDRLIRAIPRPLGIIGVVSLLFLCTVLTGCGGGGASSGIAAGGGGSGSSPTGTPAGTYTLTVTVASTSESFHHTAALTLTVQ